MKHGWIGAWALQIVEMLAAGVLAALSIGLGSASHALAMWGFVPLAGLASSCVAVCRGLNNYAAWIAPPACLYAANLIVWGYAPSAGPALVTALLSLIGAAAGQVIVERRK